MVYDKEVNMNKKSIITMMLVLVHHIAVNRLAGNRLAAHAF